MVEIENALHSAYGFLHPFSFWEVISMDDRYMLRAVELAKKGIGKVNPNPLVGAVIVKEGRVIGEGYHKAYGELHAERHAFSQLTESAKGAEMYVTLEPCCHFGKQPPCTEAIIAHGIQTVYVGSDDPNVLVAGKGIQQLQDAGIEVISHVRKEECDALNPVFFHFITTKRPYVVMKYAMTLDGKIACETGKSKWVTGEQARMRVQERRNELSGIMVGIGTVLQDNPSLTCRLPGGRNPIRIICDSHLRISLDCEIMKTAEKVKTILAVVSADKKKEQEVKALGAEVLYCKEKEGTVDLWDLMLHLGNQGIDSILLEGGSSLNSSALTAGIVNQVEVYLAPKIFSGSGKYTPVRGMGVLEPSEAYGLKNQGIEQIGEDILLSYEVVQKD